MKEIPLTQGYVAQIDDDDFERVNQYKWCALVYKKHRRRVYGFRQVSDKSIRLHRFIMDAPDGLQVDHIDGNGLNCQRANLRLCTVSENTKNRGRSQTNTSGYKGVTWAKSRNKWQASILENGREHFLGRYEKPEEAFEAYKRAAVLYHGAFANFGDQE